MSILLTKVITCECKFSQFVLVLEGKVNTHALPLRL